MSGKIFVFSEKLCVRKYFCIVRGYYDIFGKIFVCPENFCDVPNNFGGKILISDWNILGMHASQNQVKTLSWINSGKSNITPPPPKGKVLATTLATCSIPARWPKVAFFAFFICETWNGCFKVFFFTWNHSNPRLLPLSLWLLFRWHGSVLGIAMLQVAAKIVSFKAQNTSFVLHYRSFCQIRIIIYSVSFLEYLYHVLDNWKLLP